MKTLILIISLCLVTNNLVFAQTKVDTLTNENIITLSTIGLQTSVIINKIQTSFALFDVSTDALIDLNKKGVAGEVISEMIITNSNQQTAIAEVIDITDPNAMQKSGIYYYNPDITENPLNKLDAVKVNYSTSSGGYGGFGGSSTSANLNGSESKLVINEGNPTFYFYFDDKGYNDDWFDATSPNEFELVYLKIKKDKRFFRVGGASSGFMSSNQSSGIPAADKVAFDYTKVGEGIYEIKFTGPVKPGEYCFVFSSNTYKVYDFKILLKK